MSSTEAELLAVTSIGKEFIWWSRFFEEIALDLGCAPYIQVDNMQTIRILRSSNSQYTSKLRHVNIHHHWLRQEVQKGHVNVKYTPTAIILVDGLTKALLKLRHKEFVRLLGLQNIAPNAHPNLNSASTASNAVSAVALPPSTSDKGVIEEEEVEDEHVQD